MWRLILFVVGLVCCYIVGYALFVAGGFSGYFWWVWGVLFVWVLLCLGLLVGAAGFCVWWLVGCSALLFGFVAAVLVSF